MEFVIMGEDIKTISGNIVDVFNSEIYPGTLRIFNGKIVDIIREHQNYKTYIIPGFVDSHIHIESSMLPPSEFARVAAVHGTVAVVSDPHEIANVLGIDGVKYMMEDAKRVPVKFSFSAPSCVPATTFETAGAVLNPSKVEELLRLKEIKYLGEVMNFPGVINGDPDVMAKIHSARRYSKLIDGHAPGLRGKDLATYANAGITTNHECATYEEALEDIHVGMKVQIREGSAARNFDKLVPLLENYADSCMFCSDDKHPDDLMRGHINEMVKRSLDCGFDIVKVLRVASVNPVLHYGLDVGLLRTGDDADFLEVDSLKDLNIINTYIKGEIAARQGKPLIDRIASKILNNFQVGVKKVEDFALPYGGGRINVIGVIDGQLTTDKLTADPKVECGYVVSDIERDILKIAVVNRYKDVKPMIGFIKKFGLKKGAIASSVAHDSHNIIAVGVGDEDICGAVNLIIEKQGGISAVSGDRKEILPLPIAGIMSNKDYSTVAERYTVMNQMAKSMGSTLAAPFMTLSFMALPVIPRLKISDMGLFDGDQFRFISVFDVP
jgi:adenine deaminase